LIFILKEGMGIVNFFALAEILARTSFRVRFLRLLFEFDAPVLLLLLLLLVAPWLEEQPPEVVVVSEVLSFLIRLL